MSPPNKQANIDNSEFENSQCHRNATILVLVLSNIRSYQNHFCRYIYSQFRDDYLLSRYTNPKWEQIDNPHSHTHTLTLHCYRHWQQLKIENMRSNVHCARASMVQFSIGLRQIQAHANPILCSNLKWKKCSNDARERGSEKREW